MGLPATILPELPVVSDTGLDENAKNLTPERIAEVVNKVIDRETAARFRVYLNTCVHCGLCSDACHWFLSNNRDPRFSPVGKVRADPLGVTEAQGQCGPGIYKGMLENRPDRVQCMPKMQHVLPVRHRHSLLAYNCPTHMPSTWNRAAIHSGHGKQPFSNL